MRLLRINQAGFSIIELMVVTSLIALLTAIGSVKYKNFKARAMQLEGLSATKQIEKLYYSYKATHENEPPVSDSAEEWFRYDYTTETGCNGTDNPLGFRVTDCRRSTYFYRAHKVGYTGSSDLSVVEISERQVDGVMPIYLTYCNRGSSTSGHVLNTDLYFFVSNSYYNNGNTTLRPSKGTTIKMFDSKDCTYRATR